MANHGNGHIFKRFDNEMAHLQKLVIQMGELAVSQLGDAVETLQKEDPARAQKVIENDVKLNNLDIQADEEITTIIARRQPMAKDLREIIAVGKIVAELERAGDEARKIAGLTIRFSQPETLTQPGSAILADIYSLSEYVSEMLTLSMHAFDQLDLKVAGNVLQKGQDMDGKLNSILRHLSTFIMEDSRNVGHFVDIVLGIRALERFGSHAKNIAGHIVFIKNGTDVRHVGDDAILQSIEQDLI